MRALEVHELDAVSGGMLPAVGVVAFKVGGAVITGLAAITAAVYLGKRAIETAEDLCRAGSNASVRTPQADITCTAVPRPAQPASGPQPLQLEPSGMMKARMPENGLGT
ncbi:MAG: hypothetical protein ACKO6D_09240 [Rubrivivax sp.]